MGPRESTWPSPSLTRPLHRSLTPTAEAAARGVFNTASPVRAQSRPAVRSWRHTIWACQKVIRAGGSSLVGAGRGGLGAGWDAEEATCDLAG